VADRTITAADFSFVARLLHERCALVLEPGKEYLVESRLAPLVQKHGLSDIGTLVDRIRKAGQNGLITEVVEAMVTTETSFFRDIHPFETLRKTVLPELIDRRRTSRRLSIWCAACSSGQEPYSIAMLLREHFPELEQWRIQLTATDISEQMLARARAGRYLQVEVNRGLPTPLLLKWFRQDGAIWEIDASLRQTISFSRLNLTDSWPAMPPWDIVFLRNVMIYFDAETKKGILEKGARLLAPDGYLVLGGAETTLNLTDLFRHVPTLKAGFYQLRSSPLAANDLRVS
jgi:chemotaxis protein methyltransferase CheR